MKFVSFLVVTLFAVQSAMASVPAINTKSSKYAALVMDADTGEVFFSRNATAKRYPASLTKMMTLYLAFEALKAGKIKMDTRMPVSKLAASQPQTNISLQAGQTIKVEEAIKALVVRSANDVAVVMAEQLGKTERNFAIKMTEKARSLGMKATQFRNPHGLPDVQQYTTAQDMAKLSIALRRDFPQYYHYFKTKQFVWKGRTYTGHNRVLDQFDGVDGIKTGFINMSGFNLATSVKRDGYHIVGVVMGGQSGSSRDSHMVQLMTQTFTKIAERGDQPRAFASAPLPEPKPTAEAPEEKKVASLPWIRVSFKGDSAKEEAAQPEMQTTALVAEAEAKDVEAPQEKAETIEVAKLEQPAPTPKQETGGSFFRFVSEPSKEQLVQQNTLNFQLASLSDANAFREKWGIQVGAFRDQQAAYQAATKAMNVAKSPLKYSKISISDHNVEQASIHRARLANLTEQQAKRACRALAEHSTPCFVFRLDRQQNL